MVFLLILLVLCICRCCKKKSNATGKKAEDLPTIVLNKTKNLNKEITAIADDGVTLHEEFRVLGRQTAEKEKELTLTSNIARDEDNIAHNRYSDIGQFNNILDVSIHNLILVPYDSNLVTLQTPAGSPPTAYINASPIRFRGARQAFIATQAPKECS